MFQSKGGPDHVTPLRYCLFLSTIVFLGLIFRIYHFHLTIGNDDQRYIIAARELGEPLGTVSAVYYARMLWLLFLKVWGSLFGLNLESTAVLMFALGCLTTVLVAQSGRLAFGPLAGLLAASFYALHPIAVVQDTMTLPDNLANFLLAGILVLTFLYIRHGRTLWLVCSAVLIGLTVPLKIYYVLAGVPIVVWLLVHKKSVRERWGILLLFGGTLLVGYLTDMVLRFWHVGRLVIPFANIGEYGTRLAARDGPPLHTGFQHAARAVVERLEYFRWLLTDYGVVHGFLALLGGGFLVSKSGRRAECGLLAGMLFVFIGFLLFMPVAARPLRFVEMQPRYLMVVLPMLAIGAGGALDGILDRLKGSGARASLVAALAVGFALAIGVPNDFANQAFRRGSTQEFLGIRRALLDSPMLGIRELLLGTRYRETIPDSYYSLGVNLVFVDVGSREEISQLSEILQSDRGCAVFVPRSGYSQLSHALRRGEYRPEDEVRPEFALLVAELESRGCGLTPVRVPDTVIIEWLARFGVVRWEQQLVGWIYRFEQPLQ